MSINPVTQYPGKVAPATPDNPFGTARNITIPGDGTGTPWESALLKDEWALHHAILLNAGMEPNGTPDSAENSQLFKAAKASIGNGANLLSNHNFLTASPDDSQPPPDATPRSYPPGFQIFSDVFANETTGITDLTYINGRVSFTAGDFYIPRANSKELENITEFVASVADFDGKPRTRGVSYALVGDEYRVTVGVDALEDAGAVLTPLGSVKFEQGSVATGHEVQSAKGQDYSFNSVAEMISSYPPVGSIVDTSGYYERGDSAGAKYIITLGNTGDGYGSHNVGSNTATLTDSYALNIACWGIVLDGVADDAPRLQACFDWYNSYIPRFLNPLYSGSSIPKVFNTKPGIANLGSNVKLEPYGNFDFGGLIFKRAPANVGDQNNYLIYSTSAYQLKLINFGFVDSEYCLDLTNGNIEGGNIDVGFLEAYRSENLIRWNARSGTHELYDFHIDGASNVADFQNCDQINLRNGWIKAGGSVESRGGLIKVDRGTVLECKNIIGVPSPQSNEMPAWFRNEGTIILDNFRAGAEPGSMTLVNQHGNGEYSGSAFVPPGSGPLSHALIVKNCPSIQTIDDSGASGRSSILRFWGIPNQVIIKDCGGAVGTDDIAQLGDTADTNAIIQNYRGRQSAFNFDLNTNAFLSELDITSQDLRRVLSYKPEVEFYGMTQSGSDGETFRDFNDLIIDGLTQSWEILMETYLTPGSSGNPRGLLEGSIYMTTTVTDHVLSSDITLKSAFTSSVAMSAFFYRQSTNTEVTSIPIADLEHYVLRIRATGYPSGTRDLNAFGTIRDLSLY